MKSNESNKEQRLAQSLKEELSQLKQDFSYRAGLLENKINQLLLAEPEEINGGIVAASHENTAAPVFEMARHNVVQDNLNVTLASGEKTSQKLSKKTANTKANTPSIFYSLLSKFIPMLLSWLYDWCSPVINIYKSYQQRGMAAIFIITLIGIALTLLGFGYLMQLLIGELGAGSKSLLMASASITVIFIGIKLKATTQFSEFATAIVGLGLLIAYITVYFAGSVYHLLPSYLVLFLYLIVALSTHALALWLDAKVIASLGIIGIATMPMLSETLLYIGNYYLLSLVFISASSLVLAYKKLGDWLANLTMIFALLAIEWLITTHTTAISTWIIDLFYLLFFASITFSCFKGKGNLQRLFIILAATISATIMVFFQTTGFISQTVTLVYSINMVAAIAVALFFYSINNKLAKIFVLIAAIWAIFTIVSAVNSSYWGIAWAGEGLLLIYIGRRFVMKSTISEGQFLTAAALVYSFMALAPYFPLPALKSVDGWLLASITLLVIAIWQRLINNDHQVFDLLSRTKIKPILQFLEMFWLSTLLIASSIIFVGDWTGAIIIVLQIATLFRARYCQLAALEYFAASLIIIPLCYVLQGSITVNSYYFSELPTYAKVALGSAFAQLWLWAAYYRRYYPSSSLANLAEQVRTLFYLLIPVCWLGSAFRHLEENALLVLWLSPLIASLLAYRFKKPILDLETKFLTLLSGGVLIGLLASLGWSHAALALLGFIVFYASAWRQNNSTINRKLSFFIITSGVFIIGIALPVATGLLSNNIYVAYSVATLYWLTNLAWVNKTIYLHRNATVIMLVNSLLVIAAWKLTLLSGAQYTIMPIGLLLLLTYQYKQKQRMKLLNSLVGQQIDLFLHAILAITYTTLLYSLSLYKLNLLVAPALVIHGIVILLAMSDRINKVKFGFTLMLLGIAKLAIFDAANTQLWQKVILFIGIGVFLLFSAFWYQKLRLKIEKKEIELS